jgi:chromosome segregation ATPase
VGHLTQGQPQRPAFSSSDSDVYAEHCTSPFQKATPGELDHTASLRITRDRTPDPNDLPGINDKPRRVLGEDGDSEGSTEHHAKLVAPDTSSSEEAAGVEYERIADLERQLSETLAERAQLTDQLAQKSALLEQAEANAAEVKKRAGLEQRDLQAKLDELLLSRDQVEASAAEVKKLAGLEQRELQAKLDELLLYRDQALEQVQSALQKATFSAAEANERSQEELAGVHAKLEARESELAAIRLRLTDAEVGWAKSKAEADTLRAGTQAAAMAGLVNMDVDQVMRRLMERVRSVEAEVASLRGDEKSIGEMECRNEG